MAGISESPHFGSQPDEGAAYEAGLQTAQDTVEKLNNSIQQLKAEIAVGLSKIELYISTGRGEYLEDGCSYLRQLSAV